MCVLPSGREPQAERPRVVPSPGSKTEDQQSKTLDSWTSAFSLSGQAGCGLLPFDFATLSVQAQL